MSSETRAPYLVRVGGSGVLPQEQPGKDSDATRWQRVKEILDQALETPVDHRKRVVAQLCDGDTELQEEVNEYLTYTDRAEDLLGDENLEEIAEETVPPTLPSHVGPYRVEHEIGRGGMGIVCLAKRDDGEYERVVALKLIKTPGRRGKFTRLFWRERQILARLDHPNIARLLDGGTTDSGLAYYAMEFVDGEPLDRYRQRRNLNLRDKLRLFLSICSAVSYAHRNLIIHGDLKPKNVLVTPDGTPKLLDFGVARILAGGSIQTEATTRMPLTPTYASPEQIRGETLTVATDVYSLGVLLYELLSGRYPYGGRQNSVAAMRAFLEENPIPLRTQNRDIPPDLENIVMMALRKEPERRYATVDSFCRDIQAFLDGFPVQAAPDTFLYRFGKFSRRNRWAMIVASIALAAIAVSGFMIWREKRQAEMRFQQLRQLAHSVVFELDDAILDLPGSSHARELLISRGLQYLNGLAGSRNKDPGLTFELAQAYMKIAAAQGDLQQANVGDESGAFASYSKARQLLIGLRAIEPENRQVEVSLARVDADIASLAPRTGHGNADDLRNRSVALFQDIARSDTGPSRLKDLALAHFYLALAKTDEGKYADALPLWQQAFTDYQQLSSQDKNPSENMRNIGLVEKHIASVYFSLGDYPHSLEYDRKAVALDEKRLTDHPQNPTARMDLSFDLVELGWCLHALQKDQEADTAFARAIQLRRQVAAEDANDFHARSELESALRIAGMAKCQAGNVVEAIPLLQEAASTGTALHRRDPHNLDETVSTSLDYYELGEVLRKRASEQHIDKPDWQAALVAFTQAQALADQVPAAAIYDSSDREKLGKLPERIRESSQQTQT